MSGASRQTSAEKGILRIDDALTAEPLAQHQAEGSPPHHSVLVERYGPVVEEIMSHRADTLQAVIEERQYLPIRPGSDDRWLT